MNKPDMNKPARSTDRKHASSAVTTASWWFGIAFLCAVLSLRPVEDADIWFQLLAGRYALEHGAVPHQEFFLYTAAGAPQLFGGWGFGLLAELAVRLGGWVSLSVFNAVLWAATLCLGLFAAQRAANNGMQARYEVDLNQMAAMALALLIVYPTFLHRSQIRAEVTLYLSWMAATLLFESCRHPARIRRALFAFPLLCLALAWVHTTVLLMLPLLAAYALRRWQDRHEHAISRNEAVCWAICGLASVALPLLNPNGAQQVFSQFFVWQDMQDGGSIAAERIAIREYLPLWDPSSRFLWPSAAVLAMGTAVWFLTAGPARLSGLVVIAPMAIMAIQHRRGLGLWAMALLVPLAISLLTTFRQASQRKPMRLPMGALTALSMLAMLVAVVPTRYSGWGMTDVGLRAIEAVKLIGRVLPDGGNIWMLDTYAPQVPYLLGDKYKVGYAGHMIYRHSSATTHYVNILSAADGWEKELSTHNVKVIGVPALQLPKAALLPLATSLAFNPRWQLIFADWQLLVFLKRGASEIAQPREQWAQATAFVAVALELANASEVLAPDPKKRALIARLEQQQTVLRSVKDQPERLDWAAMDRIGNPAGSAGK